MSSPPGPSPSSAPTFSRPTWAEIDLAALRWNFNRLATIGGAHDTLIAVIKANAYGHGLVEIARALLSHGGNELARRPAMLAVASVDEGLQLRRAGIQAPILLLSAILPNEAREAVRAGLTATVFTPAVAAALGSAGRAEGRPAEAHFKVDTGMGRLGAWHEESVALWKSFLQFPNLKFTGAYTHFACADEAGDTMTLEQLRAFDNFLCCTGLSPIPGREPQAVLVHAANSAAHLRYPQTRFTMARCGLSLYGALPSNYVNGGGVTLKPVMTLRSRITHLKGVPEGATISYGATWRAPRRSRVATVPIGYGDGYQRALSNRAQVLIRDRRCPVVGRVTMDQILIDCSDTDDAIGIGEPVTLFGAGLPVEEMAAWAGTIPYELFTGIAHRVPRVYIEE